MEKETTKQGEIEELKLIITIAEVLKECIAYTCDDTIKNCDEMISKANKQIREKLEEELNA